MAQDFDNRDKIPGGVDRLSGTIVMAECALPSAFVIFLDQMTDSS